MAQESVYASRQHAFVWLRGEDSYMWQHVSPDGKFAIETDIEDLYASVDAPNSWEAMALSYWGRSLRYRAEAFSSLTVQYVGKLASTFRALHVSLGVVRARGMPREVFPIANQLSFALLDLTAAANNPAGPAYEDWQRTDFYETQVAQRLGEVGLPLVRGEEIKITEYKAAKLASDQGLEMLAGVIDYALAHDVPLPRPGLSSGNIEPWDLVL